MLQNKRIYFTLEKSCSLCIHMGAEFLLSFAGELNRELLQGTIMKMADLTRQFTAGEKATFGYCI